MTKHYELFTSDSLKLTCARIYRPSFRENIPKCSFSIIENGLIFAKTGSINSGTVEKFGGLECVGYSFAYVAYFVFLRDVWIWTQRTAVARRRASNLSTHFPNLATHLPNLDTHLPNLATHLPNLDTHLPNLATHLPNLDTHLPNLATHLPNLATHLPNLDTHLPNLDTHLPKLEKFCGNSRALLLISFKCT